ncbi:DUF2249 domain-containing protein [Planosporangium thailandense]|uniref:DUF2249 domain-containing protein n=1 Tax=Planosporangium thailandense TaxID=765197 RepID=A0ABX0Y304_9ACTN|nr:DUF2249 domain-containing protein [Planosporangium thailandense]NJC71950.1 DUF2249 domain-containing protein [Planosporangium thailandense]
MSHPVPEAADRDRAAAAAVRRHHAQLAYELDQHAESLLRLVDNQSLPEAAQARQDLVAYLRRDLVPHALAEEDTLYPAAAGRPAGALLVEGMLGEHRAITALVDEIAASGSLIRAASAARALTALFATHLAKENDLILPLLVNAPEVALADLLAGMHDLLGAAHAPHRHAPDAPASVDQGGGCGCGGCGCGGGGDRAAGSAPVQPLGVDALLDVRQAPHNERHALVLSTVKSLAPGEAVVLVADHAPRPVLAQVDAHLPGQIETQWLQSGPELWRVRLERVVMPG